MKKLTLYISGKISGEPAAICHAKFSKVKKEIERMGHRAVNPLELEVSEQMSWHDSMKLGIKHLMDCDGVFMLNDYLNSRAAILEVQIARALDMPCFSNFKDLKRYTPVIKLNS